MRGLLINFLSYGLATSLERLLSFLLIPLYTSVFTVTEFGIIDLIQTLLNIISIFALLQMETALQRYYYDFKESERSALIFTTFLTVFLLAIMLASIMYVLSSNIALWLCGNNDYGILIKIISIQMPLSILSVLTLIVLRFEKRNLLFSVIVIFKSFLLWGGAYLFLRVLDEGINGFFISQLLVVVITSLLSLVCVLRYMSFTFSTSILKQILQYSLPQFPARIGASANTYANRFFIVGYLSTYSIGLFAMALKFASIMQIFHQTFMMAWNQYLFEMLKNVNHKKIFNSILCIITILIFELTSVITLFSNEIMSFFTPDEYLSASKYIGGITFAICLMIISEIVDIGPKIMKKTKYLSYSFFISLAMNLFSLFLGVRLFALSGVIFSMILANLALLSSGWYFSEKIYHIGFEKSKVLCLSIPTFVIIISIMYIELPFVFRCILFGLITCYYGFNLKINVSLYKALI